jgi:hypothetical protein
MKTLQQDAWQQRRQETDWTWQPDPQDFQTSLYAGRLASKVTPKSGLNWTAILIAYILVLLILISSFPIAPPHFSPTPHEDPLFATISTLWNA